MKKLFAILLGAALVFALAACGGESDGGEETNAAVTHSGATGGANNPHAGNGGASTDEPIPDGLYIAENGLVSVSISGNNASITINNTTIEGSYVIVGGIATFISAATGEVLDAPYSISGDSLTIFGIELIRQ